eukprot:Skav223392  [mRNA]  locus=scaffold2634:513560:514351:+ [translate_table: standard]
MAISGTPLVGATQAHSDILVKIDKHVQNFRVRLLAASEAVAAILPSEASRIDFKSLNLMELAAQQRRWIHNQLGSFVTQDKTHWLIETNTKRSQNCLNKEMQYRKCLVSHRMLELLLETLSATVMKRYGELAFDLSRMKGVGLPKEFVCAKRHEMAKQHQNEDLGLDSYEVFSDSVLLVKAFEVGYLFDFDKAKRLQTVTGAWEKLRAVMPVEEIVSRLKEGLVTVLQHLRTLDVDRGFCDRSSGASASENYDIWVWMSNATR